MVILTRGVLEFMEELESADTWSCNTGCKKGRGEKKKWRCNLDPLSEREQCLVTKPAPNGAIGKRLKPQPCPAALFTRLVSTALANCCRGCKSLPLVSNQRRCRYSHLEDKLNKLPPLFVFQSNVFLISWQYLYHHPPIPSGGSSHWEQTLPIRSLPAVQVTLPFPQSAHNLLPFGVTIKPRFSTFN